MIFNNLELQLTAEGSECLFISVVYLLSRTRLLANIARG
jgi:hypothetical protein